MCGVHIFRRFRRFKLFDQKWLFHRRILLLVNIFHYLMKRNPGCVTIQLLFGFQETFFDLQNHKKCPCFRPKYHIFDFFYSPPSNTACLNFIAWNLCSQDFKHPYIINNINQNPCGLSVRNSTIQTPLETLFYSIIMGSILCTQGSKIWRDSGNERLVINISQHRRVDGRPCSGQDIAQCVWGGKDWQGLLTHPLELLLLHLGQGWPGMWRLHLLSSHPDLFKRREVWVREERMNHFV